jgi:hypothetical protein
MSLVNSVLIWSSYSLVAPGSAELSR